MRNYVAFCLLFISASLFSQEFTKPDSLAIAKNKVKSVKVYYTGTGSDHYFTKELRYDKKGRLVFEQESSAGYHYEYSYNDKNQLVRSVQRLDEDSKFVQGSEFTYYDSGKRETMSLYMNPDTAFPYAVYRYSESGNTAVEIRYYKRQLVQTHLVRVDNQGKRVYEYDSSATFASETVNGMLSRTAYYFPGYDSIWSFTYDEDQQLTEAQLKKSGKTDLVYTVAYSVSEHQVSLNGKVCSNEELAGFEQQFGMLLPWPTVDMQMAANDPVAEIVYVHNLQYDKKGNLVKDEITVKNQPSNAAEFFTYEYTFY